jgi:hypothetical protein
MLRPPNEFLSFWYLNVIGAKIKHLNCALLSDEMVTKGLRKVVVQIDYMFLLCKTSNKKHKWQKNL